MRLHRVWQDYLADFEQRRYVGVATVRMAKPVFDLLAEVWEPPKLAAAARTSAGAPDPQGWIPIEMPIESIDHAAGLLLQFGASVDALAPTKTTRPTGPGDPPNASKPKFQCPVSGPNR